MGRRAVVALVLLAAWAGCAERSPASSIPAAQVRRRLELWRAIQVLPRFRSVDCQR